jgi:hypothetical protein
VPLLGKLSRRHRTESVNTVSSTTTHHNASGPLEPSAERPYWHQPDGTRLSFTNVILNRTDSELGALRYKHIRAIAQLQQQAFAAHDAGQHREYRRLCANAARLCSEPLGHSPASAARSDH